MEKAIEITIYQLCDVAENNKEGHDIRSALGEVVIAGHTYQIQIELVANKKLWCEENEVRFSEIVKVHE